MMMVARCWGLGFDWKNDAQERHPTTTVRRHQKPGSDWRGAWRGYQGVGQWQSPGVALGPIRSRAMDQQAEYGVAGHWQYKMVDGKGNAKQTLKVCCGTGTAFCIKAGQRQVWVSNSVENK